MSSAGEALILINHLVTLMDSFIKLTGNSQKYRDLVANAIAEGRDLTNDELEQLRRDAQEALYRLER